MVPGPAPSPPVPGSPFSPGTGNVLVTLPTGKTLVTLPPGMADCVLSEAGGNGVMADVIVGLISPAGCGSGRMVESGRAGREGSGVRAGTGRGVIPLPLPAGCARMADVASASSLRRRRLVRNPRLARVGCGASGAGGASGAAGVIAGTGAGSCEAGAGVVSFVFIDKPPAGGVAGMGLRETRVGAAVSLPPVCQAGSKRLRGRGLNRRAGEVPAEESRPV